MRVQRGPANKTGYLTQVLREPNRFSLAATTEDTFSVTFSKTCVSIDNLSGEYHVEAILSAVDFASIVRKLAEQSRTDFKLRQAIRKTLAGCDPALLSLMLIANGFAHADDRGE